MMLDVFFGCLAALVIDRTLGSAVQLWSMRRVAKHITRNLDNAIERRETAAKAERDQQRKRVAN